MLKYYLIPLLLLSLSCSSHDNSIKWKGGIRQIYSPSESATVKGHIILHQGHNKFSGSEGRESENLIPIAERLAQEGFIVHAFEMPKTPHDELLIDDFISPVINYLESENLDQVYMIGLSGGGWTTSVVTARDQRIIKGYSVAGDAPRDLIDLTEVDAEYFLIDDYRSLYEIAGERLFHIYNYYDPCCNHGIEGDVGYEYLTDNTHKSHMISEWVLDFIIEDIKGDL